MQKLFDIVDGKVVLDASELSLPSFKKIYESDKSKDKVDSFNKISYIVFMYKWDSPYMSIIDEETRSNKLKSQLFNTNWELDKQVTNAIEDYKLFQHTWSLQFLEDNILGATKLMDYYRRVNWDETDKMGKPIYSSRDLAANLEKAGGILKSLHSLKEQVKKEELESNRVKGGSALGSYEDISSINSLKRN
jgi:hypothetical protein